MNTPPVPAPPSVSIIIPNYNGRENLKECLESLRGIRYDNHSVIVADGGSTDGSCEMVSSAFHEVGLIQLGKRVGYGTAVNVAIRKCTSAYIALLDNDTIVDRDWLTELVAHVQYDSLIGIAGGKVYSYDSPNILKAAGGSTSHKNGLVVKGWEYNKPTFVDWVDGCSILLRRDVVSRIGYVDDGYGLYREDVDICYRATRFGYRVLFVPSSIIWHKESQTSSKTGLKTYYLLRSWIRFCLVNLTPPFAILGSLYAVGYFFLFTGLQGLLKGKRNELGHGIRAILWNLFSLKRTLRQRSYVNRLMSRAPPFAT